MSDSSILVLLTCLRVETCKLELVKVVLRDREDKTNIKAKQRHTAWHMEQRYDS